MQTLEALGVLAARHRLEKCANPAMAGAAARSAMAAKTFGQAVMSTLGKTMPSAGAAASTAGKGLNATTLLGGLGHSTGKALDTVTGPLAKLLWRATKAHPVATTAGLTLPGLFAANELSGAIGGPSMKIDGSAAWDPQLQHELMDSRHQGMWHTLLNSYTRPIQSFRALTGLSKPLTDNELRMQGMGINVSDPESLKNFKLENIAVDPQTGRQTFSLSGRGEATMKPWYQRLLQNTLAGQGTAKMLGLPDPHPTAEGYLKKFESPLAATSGYDRAATDAQRRADPRAAALFNTF